MVDLKSLTTNERVKLWESELKFEVDEYEVVYEWDCGINEAYSQSWWYGLNYLMIYKDILENGKTFYTVGLESVSELVKQSADKDKIMDILVYNRTHENGDFTLIEVFENKEDAYNFALENYPEINAEKEVLSKIESETVAEWCNHCNYEVELINNFRPQPCSNCGVTLIPCAQCEKQDCNNCPFEKEGYVID